MLWFTSIHSDKSAHKTLQSVRILLSLPPIVGQLTLDRAVRCKPSMHHPGNTAVLGKLHPLLLSIHRVYSFPSGSHDGPVASTSQPPQLACRNHTSTLRSPESPPSKVIEAPNLCRGNMWRCTALSFPLLLPSPVFRLSLRDYLLLLAPARLTLSPHY